MTYSYFTVGKMDRKAKRGYLSVIATVLFFPLGVIYFEILFKLFSGIAFSGFGTVIMLLVSVFAGTVLCFFSTLSGCAWLNRIIGALGLSLFAFVFLVEYFVYKSFKMYYNINTILGGLKDTVTNFGSDIEGLVFSSRGILVIILYFLPALLLLSAGAFMKLCPGIKRTGRVLLTCLALQAYLFSLLTCAVVPELHRMQTSEYNFETAVANLGLIRSIRLDIFADSADMEEAEFAKTPSMADMKIAPIIKEEKQEKEESAANDSTQEAQETENTENAADAQSDTVAGGAEQTTEPLDITCVFSADAVGDNVIDKDFANLAATGMHAKLNNYVATLTPSGKNAYTGLFKGKNLIFISAEAFCAEAIDAELTPTLYRLATKGINFTDYYQPASAGTTGGEYQNIFGFLPMAGGMSFKNTAKQYNYYTMGNQLGRLGYYGKAYHNNSYQYYDRHITHINLGYSDGYMGYGNGMENYVKNVWPQSDLEMISGTIPEYIDKQPFNIYYMTVSGHGIYSRGGNAMTAKNWDKVAHLEKSDAVKGYYAAQIELDMAMQHLVAELEKAGIADDTVICISSDHFPYGLEDDELSELYGYTAQSTLERDHSRLILWCGELEKYKPIIVSSPTFSLDILPTLSNLFGTEFDSRLMVGRDVFSDTPALVFNTAYEWKTDYGRYTGGKFVATYDDIELPQDYVQNIKTIVSNKILFCRNAPSSDYYGYLFEN